MMPPPLSATFRSAYFSLMNDLISPQSPSFSGRNLTSRITFPPLASFTVITPVFLLMANEYSGVFSVQTPPLSEMSVLTSLQSVLMSS